MYVYAWRSMATPSIRMRWYKYECSGQFLGDSWGGRGVWPGAGGESEGTGNARAHRAPHGTYPSRYLPLGTQAETLWG